MTVESLHTSNSLPYRLQPLLPAEGIETSLLYWLMKFIVNCWRCSRFSPQRGLKLYRLSLFVIPESFPNRSCSRFSPQRGLKPHQPVTLAVVLGFGDLVAAGSPRRGD